MGNPTADIEKLVALGDDIVKDLIAKVRPRSLYTAAIAELSAGTRNTHPQVDYLHMYEQALGVFRAMTLELRTRMDIITLENRIQAQKATAAELGMDKQDNEFELSKQISDAIFLSNRYSLAFAGH